MPLPERFRSPLALPGGLKVRKLPAGPIHHLIPVEPEQFFAGTVEQYQPIVPGDDEYPVEGAIQYVIQVVFHRITLFSWTSINPGAKWLFLATWANNDRFFNLIFYIELSIKAGHRWPIFIPRKPRQDGRAKPNSFNSNEMGKLAFWHPSCFDH